MDFRTEKNQDAEAVPLRDLNVGEAGIGINSGDLYIRTSPGCIRYKEDGGSIVYIPWCHQTVTPVKTLTFTWE